eukprot:CAMPEP_0203944974 /NCGR_PEP_ID=MMETSP0359-20131031/80610_1 /ASSEMBLY_ACC=CAM_ASM_000338 /TAXON_ID=268821 /ORGANISM="Scrippsiella Hangoei, Strain SHTV-5" /LENGTH=46 /DNA_ID= /DNA_START= /DNA_END= /DNA_ORIENTATION=
MFVATLRSNDLRPTHLRNAMLSVAVRPGSGCSPPNGGAATERRSSA